MSNHQISEQEFCVDAKQLAVRHRLTTLSKNNFMYLNQVISAIPSLRDALRSLLPRRGTLTQKISTRNLSGTINSRLV
ncbi:MAG: hypothetical protein V7L20_23930 [Nostoc sp.]|uniref:hypothetical protein n=1 Tax=Nostoc sp. TaxID=1180 RepID=UPI002FFD3371